MSSHDRLFVYKPGFIDHDIPYFCPYSAQVIGFLTYYPEVRATVEIVELDFAKPRAALVAALDEAHQAAPMLVLGQGRPDELTLNGVHIGRVGEVRFVEKTIEILRYLAATRGVPGPH